MGLYEDPILKVNLSELMYKAGKIVAEWGIREDRNHHVVESLNLLARKKVNVMKWITHTFPKEKSEEAMMILINKDKKAIGVEIVH
jgi:threonine dehydrogenase-like Zn-dependent dehydrogenase